MLSPSQKNLNQLLPTSLAPTLPYPYTYSINLLAGTQRDKVLKANDKGPLTRPFKVSYSSVVHELTLKKKLGAQAKAQAQTHAQAYDNAQAHAMANAQPLAQTKAKAKA